MKLRRSLNYPLKDATRILEENILLNMKLPCYTDIFRKKSETIEHFNGSLTSILSLKEAPTGHSWLVEFHYTK